jgi:hypothetical protein
MTNKALIRRLQISCLGLDPIDPLRLLVDDVIEALRERALYEVQRLGQEIEQEPVAWMKPDVLCDRACMYLCTKGFTQFPECATTHPPQRTWVGLTEQEQGAIMEDINAYGAKLYSFADAIEAKLKQKNGFAEEKNNG